MVCSVSVSHDPYQHAMDLYVADWIASCDASKSDICDVGLGRLRMRRRRRERMLREGIKKRFRFGARGMGKMDWRGEEGDKKGEEEGWGAWMRMRNEFGGFG
mmetsp:Transcript_8361/g.16891  ORF Transcript_8361/g.16891 Transcript_8361/m.16891 type:complete len:102 (-) Transcript_8361:40-345(-)